MKRLLVLLAVAVHLSLLAISTYSQVQHPAVFIDRGACPFECCTYREWKTEKTTTAYARPSKSSKRVGKFVAGTKVVALTGEVRTIAGRFVVKKSHEKYRVGDIIWVYTYYGEGLFKIWFKGKMSEEDLGFSSYGGSMGKRCEETEQCWGVLDKELQMTWWIKIKSAGGWVGWTNQGENFSGADKCG
jgi:hypothetical protein